MRTSMLEESLSSLHRKRWFRNSAGNNIWQNFYKYKVRCHLGAVLLTTSVSRDWSSITHLARYRGEWARQDGLGRPFAQISAREKKKLLNFP
jgi:hypothetical protein